MNIVWENHYAPYVVTPSRNKLYTVMRCANHWETDLHARVRYDYWSGRYRRRCAAAGRDDLDPTEEEVNGWTPNWMTGWFSDFVAKLSPS